MTTESADPRYQDIARWPTRVAVEAMLEGQLAAIAAIQSQAAIIADAADAAAPRLNAGGRLVYVGAGTSGRIAVQDGVELFPTYNWPYERMVFMMAGGMDALMASREGAEDDADGARAEIATHEIGPNDVVIGIAASGRTPYTVAAIAAARATGALTIGIANNPASPLADAAEFAITAETGAEAVAGSTRMKAGTAQKAALNVLSTAIMIRLGRVYRGLMVDMRISNDKLLARGREMVAAIAAVDDRAAASALAQSDNEIRAGILIALGATPQMAFEMLAVGDLDSAIARLKTGERCDA